MAYHYMTDAFVVLTTSVDVVEEHGHNARIALL